MAFNLSKLTKQAKKLVDQRGGTEVLKQDLNELKGIAKQKGSLSDKAKEAATVFKEPGAKSPTPEEPPAEAAAEEAAPQVAAEAPAPDSAPPA